MESSQSSRIIEYLSNRKDKSFTASQLYGELNSKGISSGAVSGLVTKMAATGILAKSITTPIVFTMVEDPTKYNVRKKHSSRGSEPGRTLHREPATFDKLIDSIAGQLQILKTKPRDLSMVPTKALMKELSKRMREDVV